MANGIIETIREQVTALSIVPDFKVTTAAEAVPANDALGKIKTLQKKLEAARKAEIAPLNDQIITINARYTEPRDLLDDAEAAIKRALVDFRDAETKRLAEQRRIEQEAAAKEKGRLEEIARKQREKAAADAAKLQAKGQSERAQAALELGELQAGATEHVAQLVAAPRSVEAPTKLPGSAFREVWFAKVVDPAAFLRALLDSPYDIGEIVSFEDSALKKLASTLKGKMDVVLPGSIAWSEQVVAARAK